MKCNAKDCGNWMSSVESEEDLEECLYKAHELCMETCERYGKPECCYYYDPSSGDCGFYHTYHFMKYETHSEKVAIITDFDELIKSAKRDGDRILLQRDEDGVNWHFRLKSGCIGGSVRISKEDAFKLILEGLPLHFVSFHDKDFPIVNEFERIGRELNIFK